MSGATALVNDLIDRALSCDASDIHIEPFEHNLRIRFRIDGALRSKMTVQKSMAQTIVMRIKVMFDLDIGESRQPQDGKAHVRTGDHDIDLRASTMPTIFGEKIVLRLLKKESAAKGLDGIGMSKNDLEKFSASVSRKSGFIIVAGPTGCGKTTTLYAALNSINSPDRNIITIEDPVEYQITGISQVQINNKAGLTFARGLRSILRQDPDVIMVGEIRDEETARIAVQAALTGHLVFSTLHTNDAASAIGRLRDMGIAPYLVSSSLICVVSQRLVRTKCQPCKECSFSGFRGRTGIFEVLAVDDRIRELINGSAAKKDIEKYAQLHTMMDDGLEKTLIGLTTREEVLSSI